MNKTKLLAIAAFTALAISCSKGKNENRPTLLLLTTEKGGCFNGVKSATRDSNADTVFFTISNNLLQMNVQINNNCCSKLVDSIAITEDKITAYIADSCSIGCECKCICSYTYRYTFSEYSCKSLTYEIKLRRYGEANYSTIMHGAVQ